MDEWVLREKNRIFEDVDGIKSDFTGLVGEMVKSELSNELPWEKYRERIIDACEDVKDSLGILIQTKEAKLKYTYAFASVTSMNVLNSEIESLYYRVSELTTTKVGSGKLSLVKKVQGWLSKLKQKIKKISSHLWQLISRLLTPKSWTIHGDTGVSILGLTGNVGISITFGP